jgi:type I restriction enzyme R subunit
MVGSGTRLDPATGKLMFRVYDYTDATRLFGQKFITKITPPRKPKEPGEGPEPQPPLPPEPSIMVQGFDVIVTDAGKLILTSVDGKATPVTVEEYKERLAAKLVEEAPTLDDFRAKWVAPQERRTLIGQLPMPAGPFCSCETSRRCRISICTTCSPNSVTECSRVRGWSGRRRSAINTPAWLSAMPPQAADAVRAGQPVRQSRHGRPGEPADLRHPEMRGAAGLPLSNGWIPAQVLAETKRRCFSA